MELLLVKFHFISIIEPIIIPINLGSIVIQVVLLKFSFIEFLKVLASEINLLTKYKYN